MGDGGKGSTPRPYSVDWQTFDKNWDLIFGKKNQDETDEKKEKECSIPSTN